MPTASECLQIAAISALRWLTRCCDFHVKTQQLLTKAELKMWQRAGCL